MLNPFYLYSIIWSVVLALYSFKWSNLYPELSINLKIYFIVTILLSLFIGKILRKKYIFINYTKDNVKLRKNRIKISIFLIFIGHFLQFFYLKKIPLLEVIKNTGYMYNDFHGIRSFHVILITFNSYYCIYLWNIYILTKEIKKAFLAIICLLPFVLIYNRGIIIMIFFMFAIVYLSSIKLSLKKISIISLVGIIFIYSFGVLGNIRHHSKWNDTTYFNSIAENKKSIKILDPFFWGYVYLTSPIANLQKNIDENNVNYDLKNLLIENVVPDFIKKRILKKSVKVKLIKPSLTVSTGFIDQFLNGGILGMYLFYFLYTTLNVVITFLVNKNSKYYRPLIGILSLIVTFSFFVNMYTYSGVSFQIVYPIFSYLFFEKLNIKSKKTIEN